MTAALKLDYTYRYVHPSELARRGDDWGLRLATCGGVSTKQAEHPFFFDGKIPSRTWSRASWQAS